MFHPGRKKEAMGDEPPYLAVGTEVSAKYKGAFCEAKVRKVVRSVKCKVTYKAGVGIGAAVVTDDQIKGTLRVGATVEVKHSEKKELLEATITKIQDCSQYTVVFDDGDITTLRRTALCLKSGRHFAESETLDQLPLTHPEHFGNPVIGGRRGRRNRQPNEESSEDEEAPKKGKKKTEKEADIGKVVCVELGDKKKQKDNWFPGLVVAPTAQDTVRIRVRDDYLVRSFKDGRYYTVPKKEATEFTKEIGAKVDNNTLKTAVEKALMFLDKDELPPHWDRELLFGIGATSDTGSDSDSESSDDEPREEKDHFVAQLYKFMDDRGTPINKGPTIGVEDVDLYKLFKVVHKLGGYNRVTNHSQWKLVSHKLSFGQSSSIIANQVKQAYKKYLHSFEDFYRKLGCTMVNHPRGNRSRHRSGRSLIRDKDRATPVATPVGTPVPTTAAASSSTSTTTTTVNTSKATVEKAEKVEKDKPSTSGTSKKIEEEEEKKPRGAKPKEDKAKLKEVKEEKRENSPKPKRELKMRSERLRGREQKEEEVVEKLPWQEEDSQSEDVEEEEGGVGEAEDSCSSAGSRAAREAESTGRPRANSLEGEPPEPKWSGAKVKEEEAEEESKDRRKNDKKMEEEEKEEKATRLRAKGGVTPDRKPRETKTPVREPEKVERKTSSAGLGSSSGLPGPSSSSSAIPSSSSSQSSGPSSGIGSQGPRGRRSEEELPPPQKKRGRKRKDSDKSQAGNEIGRLPVEVQVQVGDKLKVYYGETQSKYEAKVIEVEEESSTNMFLVHYTGWNTRYDEWIPRTRIADNLSWTPARAKRSRLQQQLLQQQQQQQQQGGAQAKTVKGTRGRPVSTRSQEGNIAGGSGPNLTRSTTPSSVTSSSSRTKSPAQSSRALRAASRSEHSIVQGAPGVELRRRTRRFSGHTDISVVSESESEGPSDESEAEIEPVMLRKRKDRHNSESREAIPEVRRLDRAAKKRTIKKKSSEDEEEEEEEEEEEKEEDSDSQGGRRRGKRARRGPEGSKRDEDSQTIKSEEEQPKGRDFDLNQIRSELKGFDKAVKSPIEIPPTETDDVPTAVGGKTDSSDSSDTEEPPKKEVVVSKKEVALSKKETAAAARKEALAKKDAAALSKKDVVVPGKKEISPKKESLASGKKELTTPVKKEVAAPSKKEVAAPSKKEVATSPASSKKEMTTLTKKEIAIQAKKDGATSPSKKEGTTPTKKELVVSSKKEMASTSKKDFTTPSKKDAITSSKKDSSDDTEDIYEFKEPEPFEFEARTKRESSLSEERIKMNKRPLGRLFEDVETKPAEPKTPKKKVVKKSTKLDEVASPEGETKKRRRGPAKKNEEELERVTKSASPSPTKMQQKSDALSASEEAFKKLYESTTFPVLDTQTRSTSPTSQGVEMRSPQPLDIFRDMPPAPSTDHGDDEEGEDRLVISEPDTGTPLFSYPQRHEEMLPTPTSRASPEPGKSADDQENKEEDLMALFSFDGSKESQVVKLVVQKEEGEEGTEAEVPRPPVNLHTDLMKLLLKEDDEDEEDSINAAIQRVISQSMTDEDDDLFGKSIDKRTSSPSIADVNSSIINPTPMPGVKTILLAGSKSSSVISAATKPATNVIGIKPHLTTANIKPSPPPADPPKNTPPRPIASATVSTLKSQPSTVPSLCSPSVVKSPIATSSPPIRSPPLASSSASPPLTNLTKGATPPPVTLQHIPAVGKSMTSMSAVKITSPPIVTKAIVPLPVTSKNPPTPSMVRKTPPPMVVKSAFSPIPGKNSVLPPPLIKSSPAPVVASAKPAQHLVPFMKSPPPPLPPTTKAQSITLKSQSPVLKSQSPTVKAQSPVKEIVKKDVKKETRKKALKKTVSKEFVDDSSSDSDTSEELKLVIADKIDEESVPDSSDLDLDSKSEESKKNLPESKVSVPLKKSILESELVPKSTPDKSKKLDIDAKLPSLKASETNIPEELKQEQPAESTSKSKEQDMPDKVCAEDKSVSKSSCIAEEADASLNSLLCEETIPGSPVPPAETPSQPCDDAKVREIPFASMPGEASTSAAQQPPKPPSRPPEETAPPSLVVGNAPPVMPPVAGPAVAAGSGGGSGTKKESNEAAPVMDNTPPTTPESSLSTISGSPREDRGGSSPALDNESCKSQRDSSEVDLDSPAEGNKGDAFSESDSLLNVEVSSSGDVRPKPTPKRTAAGIKEPPESPSKKRRRTCKKDENISQKRVRHSSGRSGRNLGGCSDSDDNSENSNPIHPSGLTLTEPLLANRSPRPSKYNFYVELDPELDGGQRIALLQHKLQELRKTYMAVKAELACIDRRRKKLRRREREALKAAAAAPKPEVWCA